MQLRENAPNHLTAQGIRNRQTHTPMHLRFRFRFLLKAFQKLIDFVSRAQQTNPMLRQRNGAVDSLE